jgi:hypothetical protein
VLRKSIWKRTLLALAVLLVTLPVGMAHATRWAGENGIVRLAFNEGEELETIRTAAPDEHGVVTVDVYAVLCNVDPITVQGERLLGIGGFELKLRVEGAKPLIVEETCPFPHFFNVSQEKGACMVGINPGQSLENGRTTLVHWQLMFMDEPKNVRIGLDPSDLHSCRTLPDCPDSGTQALYVGTADSGLHGVMFGAGYAPAYLNWEGEPDTAPVLGNAPWQKVGICELVED